MAGELAPGSSARPEAIGAELGISTTPAREALQLLRAEGFLELSPGRGFTVAPMTGSDVRDLFTAQALLAGELAARAAERATDSDLVALDEIHADLVEAARRHDTVALEAHNHAFHRLINHTADARKILWMLGIVTRYVPREFYGSIPGWPESTMDDHGALLEAIRARDTAAARAAMESHILHAGALLAANFDTRTAG